MVGLKKLQATNSAYLLAQQSSQVTGGCNVSRTGQAKRSVLLGMMSTIGTQNSVH